MWLTVEPHAPPPFAEMLEQLHLAVLRARSEPAGRPRERLPLSAPERLEQQHLALGLRDRDPRGHDARVVDHRERVDDLGQLAEYCVSHVAGGARVDEQPRLVPLLRRMLRDQLRRQVVVKLARLHPVATLASAHGRVREALREGLREEAAPISRRLAEVKGLSNNTIRRLERIEETLESERGARVDDLALLVELLTEGWKAMNARLQRIEALLQAEEPGAAVYRLPTADAG